MIQRRKQAVKKKKEAQSDCEVEQTTSAHDSEITR